VRMVMEEPELRTHARPAPIALGSYWRSIRNA
jgi:hypothetical protein